MKIKIESWKATSSGKKKGINFKINSVCWKHDNAGFYYVYFDFSEPRYLEEDAIGSGSDGVLSFWFNPTIWKNGKLVEDENNFIDITLTPDSDKEKRDFSMAHSFITLGKGTIEIILIPYSKMNAIGKNMYYCSKHFHKATTKWENKMWKVIR